MTIWQRGAVFFSNTPASLMRLTEQCLVGRTSFNAAPTGEVVHRFLLGVLVDGKALLVVMNDPTAGGAHAAVLASGMATGKQGQRLGLAAGDGPSASSNYVAALKVVNRCNHNW